MKAKFNHILATVAAFALGAVIATSANASPEDAPASPQGNPSAAPDTGATAPNRPSREEIVRKMREARENAQEGNPRVAPGASVSPVREGQDDRPPAIKFDPPVADFGEMVIDAPETLTVKICNILDVPITITAAKPGCGCTVADYPKDPIAPGECGISTLRLSPGSKAPTTLHKKVTYLIEGHPSATLTLTGNVVAYVMAEPDLIEGPRDEEIAKAEQGEIKLTSGDGTPFRILDVNPNIILDIDPEAKPATEITVHISWEEWMKASRPVKVTMRTDHPKGPNVPVIIKRPPGPPLGPNDPNRTPNSTAINAIVLAVKSKDVEKVKTAIAANPDQVKTPDRLGKYPIHTAADEGNVEIAKLLLEAGADVNVGDKAGQTPLIIAAEKSNLDMVKALLDAKADVKATDHIGGTALLWAAGRAKNPEVLTVLIDAGSDVNVKDTNGWTPLHWAAAIGDPKNVELLISKKVDVNIPDQLSKDTPLMRAVRTGNVESVRAILGAGADVNAVNRLGATALLLAASNGPIEKLKAVVGAKPQLDARDSQGNSAWNLAKLRDEGDPAKQEVVSFLEGILPDIAKADAPAPTRPQPVITPTGSTH